MNKFRVNDEVWLPEHLNFKLDARIALFKGYHEEAEQTYRDYREFRAGARVVGVGEVREEKPAVSLGNAPGAA